MTIDINELRKDKRPQSSITVHALLDRLEAAEKERDAAELMSLALRAKVEQMERQKPIGTAFLCVRCSTPFDGDHYCPECGHHTATEETVYAIPGAQPAPGAQDESVRKAWTRFSNALHSSPDAPYPGMSEAFEQHFSQSFTDREWRSESGTWAAAWKAAKRHDAQPAPSVPDGLTPLKSIQYWADAYANPKGDAHFIGHGVVARLLHEYADLRAMLAAAPEAKP